MPLLIVAALLAGCAQANYQTNSLLQSQMCKEMNGQPVIIQGQVICEKTNGHKKIQLHGKDFEHGTYCTKTEKGYKCTALQ